MERLAFVLFFCGWAATGCSAGGGKPLDLTPLVSSTGGGMSVSCAPGDGVSTVGASGVDFPTCSFVTAKACQADDDCGCGCACECGVCNCNAAAAPGACKQPSDCGPSCLGLTCQSGQCVSREAGDWVGMWQGTLSWPSSVYGGNCASGVGALGATGTLGGPLTVQVVGDGDEIEVLLLSQQGSDQSLCNLPFVVSGDRATLVPGSACVTAGLPSQCTQMTDPPVAIQTFLSGTAQISGGTLSLQTSDVYAAPVESGPECDAVPKGQIQVNHESLTATLTKCPASGC